MTQYLFEYSRVLWCKLVRFLNTGPIRTFIKVLGFHSQCHSPDEIPELGKFHHITRVEFVGRTRVYNHAYVELPTAKNNRALDVWVVVQDGLCRVLQR